MNANEKGNKIHASSPESLISFMEHSHDHWFIKDKESRYIYMNESALNYFNYPKGFNVEGRRDQDMPMASHELWPYLVAHDRKTMEQEKTITSIEVHFYGVGNIDTPVPHLCDKTPYYDTNGNCIGVVGRGIGIDAPGLLYYMNRFNKEFIEFDADNTQFTKKQLELIFWVQQNLSAKEIAQRLNISYRTVENRLLGIYRAVDVHNLKQFIAYCQATGLDNYIPSDFIRKGVQLLA